MTQLDLTGRPALAPPDTPLTERQRLALQLIAARQPVPSDELGAELHFYRRAHGGSGHSPDERCAWCADEGKQMGAALRKKGLVKMLRDQGWVLHGYTPTAERESSQGRQRPGFDAHGLPESF